MTDRDSDSDLKEARVTNIGELVVMLVMSYLLFLTVAQLQYIKDNHHAMPDVQFSLQFLFKLEVHTLINLLLQFQFSREDTFPATGIPASLFSPYK